MKRHIAQLSFTVLVLAFLAAPVVAQEPPQRWIVPVVGSTAGANGAQFRTSMQLHNGSNSAAAGTIVFHPMGVAGSNADPRLRYNLAAFETLAFDDVVASLGQTGLGSLDVVADPGTPLPTITVRAFNVLPTLGTLGSNVPVLHPDDALGRGDTVIVISPADTQRYRLNIGIRTLDQPVTVRMTIYGANGTQRGPALDRSFPAEYFEQRSAAEFLGTQLQPNDSVTFEVLSGSAFVYGANTDNRTNDPNIQVDRLFGRSISADSQSVTTPEDTPVTITLSGELKGNVTPQFSITRQPSHGTLGALHAGSDTIDVVYTPDANYNGPDDFEFQISDGHNRSARGTVNITVTAVNDPPVANSVSVTTDEDNSVVITMTGSDPDGDPLTFAIASSPSAGSLDSVVPGGATSATIVYTPNANSSGMDSFTFTVNDGTANSDPATVTIEVFAANDLPVATADAYTTNEDVALTVAAPGVLANDSDIDGDTITAVLVTPPASGTLALNADGSFTYTPAANANGVVSFTYHANDGTGNSADVTVTINVVAVNDAPSFVKGADVTVLEDAGAQALAAWATAISAGPADEAAQTLTFTVTGNSNPALFATAPAVAPNGTLTFTSAADANGAATITIVVSDNGGTANGGVDTSAAQTFTITVTAVNDAPTFTKGADVTVLEDSGAQTVNPWATGMSAGPADEVAQTLAFAVTANTNAALFAVQPAISPAGVLTFTPAADASGTATITLTLADNGGTANGGVDTSAAQTFVINVTEVNDAPSFTKGADATLLEDAGAQTINPWATAISPGPAMEAAQTVAFNVVSNTNAALFSVQPAISPSGVLTFTPAPDAYGTATITINAQDNGGTANGGVDTSASQSFVITVTPVNDAPSATITPAHNVDEDSGPHSVAAFVSAISPGPANESAQTVGFTVTGNTNPTLFAFGPAIDPSGTLSYTLAPDQFGTATLTVALTDNGGTANGGVDTAILNFAINVAAVNDAPTSSGGGTFTVDENTANGAPFSARFFGNDVDTGQTLSAVITAGNTGGAFGLAGGCGVACWDIVVANSAMLDFETNPTFVVTVTATDDGVPPLSTSQTFTINLNDLNEAPAVNPATFNVDENAANGTLVGTATGTDPDAGQTLTWAITGGTGMGVFAINAATGAITVANSAAVDFEASPSFVIDVQVSDNGVPMQFGSASFTITVNNVNEAPVVTPATISILENSPNGTVAGAAAASDPDAGQTLTYAITAGNTAGAFAIDATGSITVANAAALDFETTPTFALTVTATDDGVPVLFGSATITVNLVDQNEAPVANDATFAIDENSILGSAVGTVTATDPESAALNFAIASGNTGGAFAINATTGAITVANPAALDFETNPTFTLTIFVDDGVWTATPTITINLNDVNEAPTITSGAAASVPENTTAVMTVTATDPESAAITFSITGGADAALFSINPTTGALTFNAAPDFEAPADAGANNVYDVQVQATDGVNPVTQNIAITVTDTNEAPVITSPATASVPENSTAVLTVTTTDAEGNPVTYSITGGADAALFSINPTTGALAFNAAPDFEAPADADANNQYLVEVTATDGTTPVAQTITVTVTDVNEAPVITSPAAVGVPENTTPVLTVTTTDPEGNAITYSISGGADAAFFTINGTTGALAFLAAPDFETPLDAGNDNVYNVQVQASDLTNNVTQDIAVTVAGTNEPPVITSPASASVPENTTAVLTVTSTEPEGQIVTYSITGGADAALFSIVAGTGVLTFNAPPDFEAPADADANNVYLVEVTATDGTNPVAQTVTVTVTDVNESPSFTSSATPSVPENTTAVTTVTTTDPEGNTVTYSISGGADMALLSINASTGALTFNAPPNFESPADAGANNVYDIIVTATDGTNSPTQAIAVTVTNINEAPTFTSSATPSVPENTTAVITVTTSDVEGDTITYSLSGGVDAGLFTINASTGALSFLAAPDFEAPADSGNNNIYDVQVQATDGTTPVTQNVTVTVTDQNEAPFFTSGTTPSVPENTTAVIDVDATDPEGVAATYSITGGVDAGLFSINGTTGVLAFNVAPNFESPADADTNNVYLVQVTATDGTNPVAQNLTVTVTDANEGPSITSPSAPSVSENTTAVVTVTANDPETDPITYSITGGADAALFSINGTTGALTFNAPPNFEAPADAGSNNVYDVQVTATDGTTPVNQAIAVTVTDANEAPVFTSGATPSIPENTTAVTTVTTTDPEGNPVTYSITGGADMALFTINPTTGALSFLSAPNFEAPSDAGANNVYDVIVTATDLTNSPTQAIAVTVTDANEAPVFTSTATPAVPENTTAVVTVTTTDPEGNTITYSITGGADAALFSINSSTGALTFTAPPNFEAPADAGANNVYDVVVTAADGTNSPSQAIAVTVTNVNEAPVITSSSSASVPENTTAVLTVTTTDPEGNTITYSITGGADAGDFSINASTGALTFSIAPDFEAPADADTNNVYVVQVTATDGTTPVNQTITVTVTNVNEGPTITSSATPSVPENSTPVITVTATDPEGSTITYSITGGVDAGLFTINTTTGALAFVAAPNFEAPTDAGANNVYDLQVTATDGTTPATQNMAVTVTNVNEAPVITGGTGALNVAENTVGAITTVTATDPDLTTPTFAIVGGADAGDFSINATTGALSFAATPNFEAPADADLNNIYEVTVRATDGTLFDDDTVTVTVTNVNEAPSAVGDTYRALANTTLHIAGAVTVPATTVAKTGDVDPAPRITGVKANDTDPDLIPAFNTLTITFVTGNAGAVAVPLAGTATTTTVHGSVTLHEDGSFLYTPSLGYTGADSFQYTINDGATSVTGTVSVTVVGPVVWYVKNNAPTPGNGTSAAPYQLLSAAITASAAGDTIYVMEGDGTATNYGGTNAMKLNQKLWGQGIDLDITATNGVSLPNLIVATNRPLIGPAVAPALGTVTLGNGVTGVDIQGLSINGGTLNAVDITTSGANGAGMTFANNIVTAAALEGIDVNAGGTGTVTVGIHDNAFTSTGTAIDLTRTAGFLTVSALGNNVVSGNTGGSGIVITGPAVLDSDTGTAGLQIVNGGVTVVGASGNGVGGGGVVLSSVEGSLDFTNLTIYNDNGTGLGAAGTGTGLQLRVNPGGPDTGIVESTGGPAVSASSAALDLRLTSLKSTNSTTTGVSLTNVTGTVTAPAGSSITNATGTDFAISGGTATVTYGGTIYDNTGQLISIASATGGTKTFSGAIDDLDGTGDPIGGGTANNGGGISLTSNTGATIVFSGGLALSTGGTAAFVATGGGTVTVCDENPCNPAATGTLVNTITSTTGTALNVANTTIGANGLEFRSISANGGANGIILNTTGSGALKVKGDGSLGRNGTGGTIQNTSGDAIQLTNTNNVTLQSMNLTTNGSNPGTAADAAGTSGNHTIEINGGSNVTLSGVYLNGSRGSGIVALNLSGTNLLNSNTRFENTLAGAGHSVYVNNTNVNMTLFELNNVQMVNNAATHTNFLFANTGTSNMTLTVQNNCLFEDLGTQAITVAAGGTAATTGTLTSTIQNSTFQNAKGLAENNIGILVGNGATHTATVSSNILDNIAKDGAVANTSIIRTQNSGGVMNATVTGNTIRNIAYPAAINGGRHVIGHVFEPVAYSGAYASNLTFTNNNISNITYPALGNNREAFFVDYRPMAAGGKVTIEGNTVNMPTAGGQQAIELRFRQTNVSNVQVRVRANTITHNTANAFLDVDAEDGASVQLTVDGANNFTNSNGTPGPTIAVATEDPVAAGGPSSMCVNITGNTLQGGTGTITMDETAGNMTVTAANKNAMAIANGIPNPNITTTGTPTYGVAPCTLP